MEEVKVEPGIGSIPEIKTTYYYVYSCMISHSFTVKETEWIGGFSDSLRLAKGNVYLNIKQAYEVCDQLNARLESIRNRIDGERQKQRLKEELARKRQEAAERKAAREEEAKKSMKISDSEKKAIRKNSELVKAKAYEKGKKKRKAKSPHPDIII